MRKEAVKTKQKRLETRELWFELNPPDSEGFWYCYLQISPSCPLLLTEDTVVLEHVKSKARRPDLKHDVWNISPACEFCNAIKLSKDVGEL